MSSEPEWKRDTSRDYPKVWLRFKARDLDSDQMVEYRVEDLTEDRFDDAIDHMATYFLKDEPICKSKKLIEDESATADMRKLYHSYLEKKCAIVCYKENSNEIVGLNITAVSFQKEKEEMPELSTQKMIDLLKWYHFLNTQFNVYEHFKVDRYLTALGLSVKPEYRGRNIGYYILLARVPLCKELGVKVTSTVFTAIASQTLAAKAGFSLNYEISYEELARQGHVFENIGEKCVKIMSFPIA